MPPPNGGEDDGERDAEGELEDLEVEVEVQAKVQLGEETKMEVRKETEKEVRIKREEESGDYGFSEIEEDTDDWSSEDEIPLAKLRKAKKSNAISDDKPRAEREGAPGPEVGQQMQVSSGRVSDMGYGERMGFEERGRMGYGERMYGQVPRQSLPAFGFGEGFGRKGGVYVSPYQGEWGQFEDTRVGWTGW